MRDSLRAHPLFKEIEITDELRMVDKCIDIMETQTEEGKKVCSSVFCMFICSKLFRLFVAESHVFLTFFVACRTQHCHKSRDMKNATTYKGPGIENTRISYRHKCSLLDLPLHRLPLKKAFRLPTLRNSCCNGLRCNASQVAL